MIIWTVILLVSVLPAFFISQLHIEEKKRRIWTMVVGFIPLWFVHVFYDGYSVPDVPNYIDYFCSYIGHSFGYALRMTSRLEPGYIVLTKFLTLFTSEPQFLIFVIGTFIILSYAIFIARYSSIIWISILLFVTLFFEPSLYIFRNYIAVAICILSVPFILKRKLVPFLLMVLLAYSMHQSALIFLPAYFIYDLKVNWWTVALIIISSVAVYFVGASLVEGFLSDVMGGVYGHYLDGGNTSNLMGLMISVVEFLFFVFVFDFKRLQGIEKLMFLFFLVGVVFDVLSTVVPLVFRMKVYYSFSGLILLPAAVNYIKKDYLKIPASVIISGLFIIQYLGNVYESEADQYFRLIF